MKKLFILLALVFFCVKIVAQEWALTGLPTNYTYGSFHSGLAVIEDENNLYGAINRNGEIAIEPIYLEMSDFNNGVSIVKYQNGYGVINSKGVYILPPIYDEISDADIYGSGYIFEVKKDGLQGVIKKNGTFIIPLTNKPLVVYFEKADYPFVNIMLDKEDYVYNAFTDELTIGEGWCIENHNEDWDVNEKCLIEHRNSSKAYYAYIYIIKSESTFNYYSLNGENLQVDKKLMQSSKGLEVFYDETSRLWGFKNKNKVIVTPKYNHIESPLWIGNYMVVNDNKQFYLIDSNGNEFLSGNTLYYDGECVIITDENNNSKLYSIGRKEFVWEPGGKISKFYGEDYNKGRYGHLYYTLDKNDNDGLYRLLRYNYIGKKYGDRTEYTFLSHMFYPNSCIVFEGCQYISEKMNSLGIFTYCNNEYSGPSLLHKFVATAPFSEKVALAKNINEEWVIINYSCSEIGKFPVGCRPVDSYFLPNAVFSEDVMPVENIEQGWIGYLYNPLAKKNYAYNNPNYPTLSIDQQLQRASSEFDKGNYGIAKNLYYDIMLNEPSCINAMMGYGASLGELGYDEQAIEVFDMILDIEPSNTIAQGNKNILQERKARVTATEESVDNGNNTIWSALSNFGNVLFAFTTNGDYSRYQDYYSQEQSENVTNTSDYKVMYTKWENRAKANYNSLTNLGTKIEENGKDVNGTTGQSMGTGNYIRQKQALREAQRQMMSIRQKANKMGINIPQSHWETVSVSY